MQIGPRPAYENERHFSPGFQVVRPSTGGFFGAQPSQILVTDIRNVSLASPTTVPSNIQSLSAASDDNNNYDGASAAFKSVMKLSTPTTANDDGVVSLSLEDSGLIAAIGAVATIQISCPSGSHTYSYQASYTIRVRPVMEDFDQTLSTWDLWTGSPPTLGAAVTSTATSAATPAVTVTGPLTVEITDAVSDRAPNFIFPSDDEIYGFILDIQPVVDVTGTIVLSGGGLSSVNSTVLSSGAPPAAYQPILFM